MKHLIRYVGFCATVMAAVSAAPAAATVWEWSFPSTGCNDVYSCTVNSTSGPSTQTMKIQAFSTNHLETTDPQSSTPTGNWIKGKLFNYSGGLGITNTLNDTNEGSSPEHAVDNNQVYDVMIFELPKGMEWDLEAFKLAWARENNAGTSADVQMWFGGNTAANATDVDFTQVCFTGCANSLLSKTGTMSTMKDVTNYIQGVADLPDNNIPQGQTMFLDQSAASGTQNGRYLIMTGALGQKLDAFKPSFIKADGNKTVPVPGTLALLGLGLVGLISRRRLTAA